ASSTTPKSSPSTETPTASRKPRNDPSSAPANAAGQSHDQIRNRLAPHHLVANPDLLDTRASLRRLRIDQRPARRNLAILRNAVDRRIPRPAQTSCRQLHRKRAGRPTLLNSKYSTRNRRPPTASVVSTADLPPFIRGFMQPLTPYGYAMDQLTFLGIFSITAMVVTYSVEDRYHWFILAFAAACLLGSIYGFLVSAWPFGVIEAIWAAVAVRRWLLRSSH